MRFGQAIDDVMKYGYIMVRDCWNGCHVGFHMAADNSDMTSPYFYISNGDIVAPWFPDVFDMTAHDWRTYEEQATMHDNATIN